MRPRVGVDIGGTFTDFVLLQEGEWRTHKVLTSALAPEQAVLQGLGEMMEQRERAEVEVFAHATTLATNAILERRGARVGLITTAGFRDVLTIGRSYRYDMQDLAIEMPQPLLSRSDIVEVRERMSAEGDVVTALDVDEVVAAARALIEGGVEAIAVGFLHSFRNPEHENLAGEALRNEFPDIPVSLSAHVAPVMREFERFTTSTANSYVQPLMREYLDRLNQGLVKAGVDAPVVIMLSNGGLADVSAAASLPVRMIESGPAAGVIGAAQFARSIGFADCLVMDVGGTTGKGAVLVNGEPGVGTDLEVARLDRYRRGSGLPILAPSIELIEIGTGGGSIATVDQVGRLRVGPESASSNPGPACYGLGGTRPTVTDADLVLGYLNAERFAAGSFDLEPERSLAAINQDVGEPLGIGSIEAAWGIHGMLNEEMAAAIRIHTIERGIDVRRVPMVVFGGCGPVHASGVAELLDISTVVVPRNASVFSARGLLVAPPAFEVIRSFGAKSDQLEWAGVNAMLSEMEAEAVETVQLSSPQSALEVVRVVEMRYVGQAREISVELPSGELSDSSLPAIESTFSATYERIYHETMSGVQTEVVSWRVLVRAVALSPEIDGPADRRQDATPAGPSALYTRPAHFGSESFEVPAFDWDQLESGQHMPGPAFIEGLDTTVVVRPSWDATVLPGLHIRMQRSGGR